MFPPRDDSNFLGSEFDVLAVNYGTATLHIGASDWIGNPPHELSADIPITVWPNGTWKGSVQFLGACLGSDPAYGETVQIAVNDAGVGTLTATDTPGFVRQYAITIPSSPAALTFESAGVFLYNNGITVTSVPGRISVTLKDNEVDYRETTGWGNCSNLYAGSLSKQ